MEPKNYQNGITVLSLFDGCSAAYLALEKAGFKVNNYYSSEIDKHCLAVQKHHYGKNPNFHQVGDVRNLYYSIPDFFDVDVIIMGAPCTQLSSINAKDRSLGLDGPDSKLFFDALKIIEQLAIFHTSKKLYFLAENVASMSNKNREIITESFKRIFPVTQMYKIDSAFVAPAHRRRLYWTNIPNVTIPEPNGKSYQGILINGYVDRDKANVLLSSDVTQTNGIKRYYSMNIGNIIFRDKEFAELPIAEKLQRYPAILKDSGHSGKKGFKQSDYDFLNGCYRLPSVLERERMMTIPDGYVSKVPNIPKSEQKKILGLSFTVDVVAHILGFMENT